MSAVDELRAEVDRWDLMDAIRGRRVSVAVVLEVAAALGIRAKRVRGPIPDDRYAFAQADDRVVEFENKSDRRDVESILFGAGWHNAPYPECDNVGRTRRDGTSNDIVLIDVETGKVYAQRHAARTPAIPESRIEDEADAARVFAPRDRVRIAAPGDAMVGTLGVVESVSTHTPTGRQYADVRTDDGSRATWPADELERVDAPHVVDCLCSPCEDARWKSPAVPA